MLEHYCLLIAHDAPMFQSFLARMLELSYPSATIRTCANGLAALHAYEQEGADLLITDYHMPEMDGLELIRTLRSRQVAIPIVALSGESVNEQELRSAGADAFLRLPFSISEFKQVVYALLPP